MSNILTTLRSLSAYHPLIFPILVILVARAIRAILPIRANLAIRAILVGFHRQLSIVPSTAKRKQRLPIPLTALSTQN